MNKKLDIIIIGGGPCGTFSAYNAAKQGANVVICEEHQEVGVPNHCAGHLNISSIKKMDIQIPKKCIENTIKGANFYSPSVLRILNLQGGESHQIKSNQNKRRVEENSFPGRVSCAERKGNRTRIHRKISKKQEKRHLRMRWLRKQTFQFRHKI